MANKPFRIETTPRTTDIGRMPNGKFTRIVPPAPPQIVQQSSDRGIDVQQYISDNRAPDHLTPVGKPDSAEEIPWPEAGPVNDADKKPMKLE